MVEVKNYELKIVLNIHIKINKHKLIFYKPYTLSDKEISNKGEKESDVKVKNEKLFLG